MSQTGSYRFIDGEWVKVSDKPPRLVDAYVPEGGYWDEHLGSSVDSRFDNIPAQHKPVFISSKEQKARLMRERGVVEDGGFTPVKRTKFLELGNKKATI